MVGGMRSVLLVALLLVALALLVACGDWDDEGAELLTRADVEEIVRSEVAGFTSDAGVSRAEVEGIVRSEVAGFTSDAGVSRAEVEGIVRSEVAGFTSDAGVSRAEVEGIVRSEVAGFTSDAGVSRAEVEKMVRAAIAAVPPRSAPAEYTRFFVESAIARYETQGLEATLAHYNRAESVDGQWYVFIIDGNDLVIAHPDPGRRGLDVKGWVGTDANGYNFGPEMLSATEDGKWVSYVYRNPESGGIGADFGELELKNVWVDRHDGLLFASGWYIDADEFTKRLVSIAVDTFRQGGLPATVAYFASPGSALAGLEAAIAYYNAAETVEGHWFAFIGDPDGKIAAHSDTEMIGRDTRELFGSASFQAPAGGDWVATESLRVWVAGHDGFVFGSGWSRDE